MIHKLFKNVIEEYPNLKKGKFERSSITEIITKKLPELITKKVSLDIERYKIYGSYGRGNWAEVPWLCILQRNVTESTRTGYYIAFLLNPEKSEYYLSLAVGWTQFEQEFDFSEGRIKIRLISKKLERKLGDIPRGFTGNPIDLSARGQLAKGYELGQILSKRYSSEEDVSNGTIISDIKALLKTYEDLSKIVGDSVLNISVQNIEDEKLEDEVTGMIAKATLGKDLNHEISELLKRAEKKPPVVKKMIMNRIIRNRKLSNHIKERAKFICEICGVKPFIQKNGQPYAEADHVDPLGNRGIDHIDNMRCLCPQCHAIITHGSKEEVERLFE